MCQFINNFLLIFVCSLLAACATTPQQSFRWDVNRPFATFKGTPEEQRSQVDTVLNKTNSVDSMVIFIAADTAYSLNRLDDAGFLFNAASIRAIVDLKKYPSQRTGSESPGVYLGFLRSNAGQVINPTLVDNPEVYKSVANRISKWDCNTISNYKPGWDHQGINNSAESCESVRDKFISPMLGIAKLFQNQDYVKHAATVKRYNLLPRKEKQSEAEINTYKTSLEEMRTIENRENIKGFASYVK